MPTSQPPQHKKPVGSRRRDYYERRNTHYARKLAAIWETDRQQPFPGGVENAWLYRLNPSFDQKAAGHWIWELSTLEPPHVVLCGSPETVRECIRDPENIEYELYIPDEPMPE